jgi:N-acetylglutamate synthase-like GNAT family acetyltransferase
MVTLRNATETDQARITAIIREVRINPMDLKWKNFVVAVDEATGEIVGTGQIKTHRDSSRGLASIAVVPEYQGRGLARQIIEHLLTQTAGTLYLTCRSPMGPMYEKFGFREIGVDEMTPYFRRLKKIAGVFNLLTRDEYLMVMKRES